MDDKKRKIALVTGGNRGLGYETCKQLAQLGLRVLLGARDMTKGKSAAYQLNEKEGLDVMFYEVDVSNQKSIYSNSKRGRSTLWTFRYIGQ
jgi:NAD(P)-dependent dehydrogenase (short-subunit alcohol dehydrogenase family)